MAHIPPVSATSPPPPSASGLSGASVQQAPAALTTPGTTVQLTGTVTSSNPQTQQLNIQTPQGTIVVQSAAPLPPDTQVALELFTDNTQTRATITVIRQNVAQTQTQTLQNLIQPDSPTAASPPLQEGDTVTALQLQQQPSLQIAQLAASIETLKETGLQNIQPPLPPQLMQELLTTSDLQSFLKELPPQMLQNIANSFGESGGSQKQAPIENSPDIRRQMLSAYLPQKSGGAGESFTAPENALPDILDNNLLQIMRAQLQAKATQQNIQSPPAAGNSKPASFSPLTSALDALFSSSEEASQKTSGFSSLLRLLIPQGSQESTPAPQNMFQLHILKIFPPETTPEQINTALQKMPVSGQLQTGEVETTTPGGQPILQTADDSFVIRTPVSVPVGSKIIFAATPMTPEELLQTGTLTAQDSALLQNGSWPALQEALQALSPGGSQAVVAQALRNTLPTPNLQLAPTALFFLAAMRSGSINNWLGANTLQALQQIGKTELIASLTGDFDKLAAQSKDVLAGNWRSIAIPLLHDEQISQMQFYVRQQHDQSQQEKEQGSGKPATRFILNLSLSRMGMLQLDGFIQKKNFDIILRTEDKLPFDMRQELMKRFAQGLDQVQMQGGISFQTKQQSWMVPEAGNMEAEA